MALNSATGDQKAVTKIELLGAGYADKKTCHVPVQGMRLYLAKTYKDQTAAGLIGKLHFKEGKMVEEPLSEGLG